MPYFRDDDDDLDGHPASTRPEPNSLPIPIQIQSRSSSTSLRRRLSEESIRTELCEGPIPDSPKPPTPGPGPEIVTSDRADLIERLKRGESPTWVPNRHLESLLRQNGSLSPATNSPRPRSSASSKSLLPAATIANGPREGQGPHDDEEEGEGEEAEAARRIQEGLNIERPRSALHSGDFTHHEPSRDDEAAKEDRKEEVVTDSYRPSRRSWLATSPPRDYAPLHLSFLGPTTEGFRSGLSSLSSSLSSSFFYKHPTSPLVQSESNDELDLSLPMNNIDITPNSPTRYPRRQTLASAHSASVVPTIAQKTTLRRGTNAYQAHQPRSSLTSAPSLSMLGQSPQTPAHGLRSGRPSFSSESSPMQHASMVGSYEESILRGRMSTTPSGPLDFLAQIGVLGLGDCRASLRCPAHVSLHFPAVFYSYASASAPQARGAQARLARANNGGDDGPSPYVGQIDLENGLPGPEEKSRARRRRAAAAAAHDRKGGSSPRRCGCAGHDDGDDDDVDDVDMPDAADGGVSRRAAKKQKRRSNATPKAPPGGSYRIPEKGQLQIVIKNQNKTAVKLFLVPYDLAGMEPGTKTFIRQRSYSAGPIIAEEDSAVPAAAATTAPPPRRSDPLADRPVLRYLVHLHICCPARGRYYLYRSVRVVFANRVSDGLERLRNEVTVPEPRFSPYRPVRVMTMTHHSGAGGGLAADKASQRRRSSGMGVSLGGHGSLLPSAPLLAADPGLGFGPVPVPVLLRAPSCGGRRWGLGPGALHLAGVAAAAAGGGGYDRPVEAVPLSLAGLLPRPRGVSDGSDTNGTGGVRSTDSSQGVMSRPATGDSGGTGTGTGAGTGAGEGALRLDGHDIERYDKLSKGDVGYGGNAFAAGLNGSPGAAEGLLSQRLRSLEMRNQAGGGPGGQGQG